jgi:ADP-ribose diphosphatase
MAEQSASRIVYPGAFIRVREQFEPQPLGGTQRFEIVEHKDAVAMVAVRRGAGDQLEVALVKQRRPAVDRDLWEIPAGLVDENTRADPLAAAKRELREEIGYAADDWHFLTRELPSPGFSTEAISIYLAMGVHPAPGATPGASADPTEIAAVRWLPLAEAVADRTIDDGKTILGLHLADELLDRMTLKGAPMPLDIPNMPFPSVKERGVLPSLTRDSTLRAENMLLEEFTYASTTAYQAMEDRARMFSFYLTLVGVLITGLGVFLQLGGAAIPYLPEAVMILFGLAGALGTVFFIKLIRLRQANRDSIIAMNRIKEYYIALFRQRVPGLEGAFAWRLETVPGERIGNVTFLVCYTVAVVAGLTYSAAVFVFYQQVLMPAVEPLVSGIGDAVPWILAAAVFVVALLAHNFIYVRQFDQGKLEKRLRKVQDEVEKSVKLVDPSVSRAP